MTAGRTEGIWERPSGWVGKLSPAWFRVICASLIALSASSAFWLDTLDGFMRVWAGLAIAVPATLVYGLTELRSSGIETAHAAIRGDTIKDIAYALEPVVQELARISTLPVNERRDRRLAMRGAITHAAAGLGTGQYVRSCYFELVRSGRKNVTLEPREHVGRAGKPAKGFKRGQGSGTDTIRMVLKDGHMFCLDVNDRDNLPDGWVPPSTAKYRSFISVTAGTPGKPVGMLTIDALEPGDLTEEDVELMRVLGHLLGLSEQITK